MRDRAAGCWRGCAGLRGWFFSACVRLGRGGDGIELNGRNDQNFYGAPTDEYDGKNLLTSAEGL